MQSPLGSSGNMRLSNRSLNWFRSYVAQVDRGLCGDAPDFTISRVGRRTRNSSSCHGHSRG